VGNRRLSIKDSAKIQAEFARRDNGQKIVVALNEPVFKKLKPQLLQETLSDKEVRELAWKIAAIPEEELFVTACS
jgi:formylmethanofuran dehydrogenase subunit E